jgi:hypothetical protein
MSVFQQLQPGYEASNRAPDTQRGCPAGSQCDGERQIVQSSAHICNKRRLAVGDNEISASCRRAFDEELYRRITQQVVGRWHRIGVRRLEGRDAIAMLTLDPQQFATCRQEMDLISPLKELLGNRSDRFDHVLAAIQDNEQLSRTDGINELRAYIVGFFHKSQGCLD